MYYYQRPGRTSCTFLTKLFLKTLHTERKERRRRANTGMVTLELGNMIKATLMFLKTGVIVWVSAVWGLVRQSVLVYEDAQAHYVSWNIKRASRVRRLHFIQFSLIHETRMFHSHREATGEGSQVNCNTLKQSIQLG